MKPTKTLAAFSLAASLASNSYVLAQEVGDGNRYNRDRFYHSEISNSEAYLAMMQNAAVILDVRTLREYSAGHPERAYNIPYPLITNDSAPLQDSRIVQDPDVFYWEVYRIVKGKLDTPLVTVCRTGSRSIAAANILATGGAMINGEFVHFGEPFTNVRNHWPGFVGQYLYAFDGGTIALDEGKPIPLDLDNDGMLNLDAADIFSHTTDKNPDKDGWRNFGDLPFSTQIRRPLAYMNDVSLYAPYFEESRTPPQAGRPPRGNSNR